MREVATNTMAFDHGLCSGPRGPCMMIAEFQIPMHKVADRLYARPTGPGLAKAAPRFVRQKIGIAIATAQQIDERIIRQILHRMLVRGGCHRVGLPCVTEDAIRGQNKLSRRSHEARAPVAEPVPVADEGHRRCCRKIVRINEIAIAAVMDAENGNQRRRLRKAELQAAADPDQNGIIPFGPVSVRRGRDAQRVRTHRALSDN